MRKNSLTRQVRRAYRQGELARICTLREDRFGRAFGMQTVKVDAPPSPWRARSGRPEDYYHFRDNGASVLAVAHLDTVVRGDRRTPRFRDTERGPLIVSGALDDRLGAYVILHLLPKLGITCDWLLTVGEESGQSTAEHFDAGGKKYDWVIEFDRGGTDVVMYQYEDRASRRLVEAAGADMGHGSFSDIAYLDQLDVKAFNWGVGYDGNYHSEAGYAYLNNTFAMVGKYLRFHEQNAGTRLPHDPDERSGRYGSYGLYDTDDYYDDCVSCGEKRVVDSVTWYCTFCGICQDCGATDPDVAAGWNDPDVDVCQCYAPRQRGTGVAGDRDWRAMDWDEYCELRPAGPDDTAARMDSPPEPGVLNGLIARESARRAAAYQDATCDDCGKDIADACTCALDDAHAKAQDRDGQGTLISAAPPWSEHRPSYGLGVPTGRKVSRQNLNSGAASYLSGDLTAAVTAYRDRSAVNPPAVFPDADQGWHEAARHGADGLYVVAHEPAQTWAQICLRCAARWPHPVASRDVHPESVCPGCDRCQLANIKGAIHVIPAHLAGDSDLCGLCIRYNDALSETDRGDEPAGREMLRALDAPETIPGLVSQEAADRYLAQAEPEFNRTLDG